MTQKEYQELRAQIQKRYEDAIAALNQLYAMLTGPPAGATSPEVLPESRPAKRHYAKRGTKLSPEEKRARQAAYQEAYRERRRKEKLNGDQLSSAKFNEFLTTKPQAAGGIG